MKNRDQEIEILQATLAPLDGRCPLPRALAAERVLREAAPPRRDWGVPLRRAAAFAAAVAVILTTAFVSGRLGLFRKPEQPPVETEASTETTEAAEPLGSYRELEQAFLRMQKNARDRAIEKRAASYYFDGDMVLAQTMPAAVAREDSAEYELFDASAAGVVNGAADFGKTNTQVLGVDEADLLKNDGQYLYYIPQTYGNTTLYILQALPADGMKVLSSMSIPGYRQGTELYVQGSRMALVYSEYPPGGDPAASVQVYDITDRTAPKMVKSFSQKGQMLSSRMQGGRIYLISTQGANLNFRQRKGAIPEEDILPRVYNNGEETLVAADCVAVLPESAEPSYLMVSSLDLQSNATVTENAAILGAGSQVYCTTEALYVASQQYAGFGDGLVRSMPDQIWGVGGTTRIYRFALLPDGKIQAGGQGEVPGGLLNQFSMDEYQGHFRMATTGWDDKGEQVNFVSVLDKDLKIIGTISSLAPGERIQSVRFIGPTGYVVTFRQTDPLFVIDLADPAKPKVLGELKLPGFSAYLHPWDATHLIGVGPDGDEQGLNNGVKVSLFDISDPAKPREADKAVVKDCWTDIQQHHKAFAVCAEQGLFGLPLQNNNGAAQFYTFRVDGGKLARGATLKNPDATYDPMEEYYGSSALRGTYIGQNWYVLGIRGAAAYGMADGKELGKLAL